MRYFRYLWHRVFPTTCGYTEDVLEDGLTQYQRDLCEFYHTPSSRARRS